MVIRCFVRPQRLLDYITPDFVHVMIEGKIVQTGGMARERVVLALVFMLQEVLALAPCNKASLAHCCSHLLLQELAASLEKEGYANMA